MVYKVLLCKRIRDWVDLIALFDGDNIRKRRLSHIPALPIDGNSMEDYPIGSAMGHFNFQELLLLLVCNYEEYRKNQINSSNELVQKISNYMKLCKEFQLLESSIREGNSIGIESIMCELLPVWKAAHKVKYVDLTAANSEMLYQKMDHYTLEMMRLNRCARLSRGKGMVGMDNVCEQLNNHTKEIVE